MSQEDVGPVRLIYADWERGENGCARMPACDLAYRDAPAVS